MVTIWSIKGWLFYYTRKCFRSNTSNVLCNNLSTVYHKKISISLSAIWYVSNSRFRFWLYILRKRSRIGFEENRWNLIIYDLCANVRIKYSSNWSNICRFYHVHGNFNIYCCSTHYAFTCNSSTQHGNFAFSDNFNVVDCFNVVVFVRYYCQWLIYGGKYHIFQFFI